MNASKFIIVFIVSFMTISVFAQGNWSIQQSGTTANLTGLWFTDMQNGCACGDSGIILNTTNGGNTWIRQQSGTSLHLEDIYFMNIDRGWAAGDSGTILV